MSMIHNHPAKMAYPWADPVLMRSSKTWLLRYCLGPKFSSNGDGLIMKLTCRGDIEKWSEYSGFYYKVSLNFEVVAKWDFMVYICFVLFTINLSKFCHLWIFIYHFRTKVIYHTEIANWHDCWRIHWVVTVRLWWLQLSGKIFMYNITQSN